MDSTLLQTPLVDPSDRLRKIATPAEADRLRALAPSAYWLEIATELAWDVPPISGLDGKLGEFRYFAGAMGNVSTSCLDRHPDERVACTTSARMGCARPGRTAA